MKGMMMMMLKMRTLPRNFGQTTRKERKQSYRIVIKTAQFLSLQKRELQDAPFCVDKKSHKQTHKHTHGSQENKQRAKI